MEQEDDRESGFGEGERALLSSLERGPVPVPRGLRERLVARVHLDLLRRDVADLLAAGPIRLLRQLLRWERPHRPSGSDRSSQDVHE